VITYSSCKDSYHVDSCVVQAAVDSEALHIVPASRQQGSCLLYTPHSHAVSACFAAWQVDAADNIDLMTIVQEFVDYYHSKFGRYPKLIRRNFQPAMAYQVRQARPGHLFCLLCAKRLIAEHACGVVHMSKHNIQGASASSPVVANAETCVVMHHGCRAKTFRECFRLLTMAFPVALLHSTDHSHCLP
jgi:hypothetical protein